MVLHFTFPGCQALNTGPHASVASTMLTGSFSQLLLFFLDKYHFAANITNVFIVLAAPCTDIDPLRLLCFGKREFTLLKQFQKHWKH